MVWDLLSFTRGGGLRLFTAGEVCVFLSSLSQNGDTPQFFYFLSHVVPERESNFYYHEEL